LLGRLDGEKFMSGTIELDVQRVRTCFEARKGTLSSAEFFAEGILRVVETQMERAIRLVSIERGHDPRDFTLVAFGGGGPLHACAVARALSIPRVMVPAMPGALSAVGILLADSVRDYSRTVMLPHSQLHALETEFRALEALGTEGDSEQGRVFERSLDLRYAGQGYELNVPWGAEPAESFHEMHQQRYGFANRERALEIVNVRLRVRLPAQPHTSFRSASQDGDGSGALRGMQRVFFDGEWHEAKVFDREKLHTGDRFAGPALITEYTSVTVLPPDAILQVDELGNLMIDVEAAQ
jgi:N-methylhydantoinase A